VTTVVHLITTLTQGGAERVLSETVPLPGEHADERHVVVSLVPGGMFADVLRERGVEVRDLGMRPGRDLLRGTFRLVQLLRDVRADVVIGWMYHACLLMLLAAPFARRARQRIWFLQGSLHSLAGLPWHTRLTVRVLAITSRWPDAIAINSLTGRAHHRKAGYRPRRWIILPNGCDTSIFRPDADDRRTVRAQLGIDPRARAVICVARDHPQKDLPTLVAALQQIHGTHPDVELILAGTGTERLGSKDEVGPRIHGLGERRDVARLLRAADVLAISSLTEGLPNALLEGMASGLVPVTTDVGDCRAVVGETGSVVPSGSVDALSAALDEVLSWAPAELQRRGALAQERVIARYGIRSARKDYRALWTDLTPHPAPRRDDRDRAGSSAHPDRSTVDSAPLTVVHVIARMNVGGPAQILSGLLEHLDAEEFPQHLIVGEVGAGEEDWFHVRAAASGEDPRIVRIPGFGRAVAPVRDLRTYRRLVHLLRELAPDVVHTHTAKAGLLGRAAAARVGTRHVLHTYHGHTLHGYFAPPVAAVFTHLERLLARRTDDLIAVGARVRDELLAAGVGRPEQYSLLSPGVPVDDPRDPVASRTALGLPLDVPVVAFVGRLSSVKRPDRYLDAAALVARRHPTAVFLVVGDGELRAGLEAQERSTDVRFLGWRGDVDVVYAAADVVAVTSDNEGMPVTLIEASAAGRACVTTDVGSAAEIVADGVTGRVVPPDHASVAAALDELLSDPVGRAAMGAAARHVALERFGMPALVQQLSDLYRRGPVGERR
jgi:glycosyltransferase involved in cell wall biosynthesis